MRGLCNGIAVSVSWLGNFCVTSTFLSLAAWLTPAGAFLIYSCLVTVGVCVFYFALPETSGLSFEEIQAMYGVYGRLQDTPPSELKAWVLARRAQLEAEKPPSSAEKGEGSAGGDGGSGSGSGKGWGSRWFGGRGAAKEEQRASVGSAASASSAASAEAARAALNATRAAARAAGEPGESEVSGKSGRRPQAQLSGSQAGGSQAGGSQAGGSQAGGSQHRASDDGSRKASRSPQRGPEARVGDGGSSQGDRTPETHAEAVDRLLDETDREGGVQQPAGSTSPGGRSFSERLQELSAAEQEGGGQRGAGS